MRKRWPVVLNVIVLIIITLVLIMTILKSPPAQKTSNAPQCINVNKITSFVYDSCYDAYTKNIFLKVRRSFDTYQLKAITFSFFDFSNQTYKITNVPDINQSKAYKIPAGKNPKTLNVRLKILKDFSAPICKEPRILSVRYCPSGVQQKKINASISPLGNIKEKDFIKIMRSPRQTSDIFSLNLVDREAIWKSLCESRWQCSGWGACDKGVRKRSCKDLKNCFISTDIPKEVKYCNGACHENWECTWSECSGGFTIPTCKDLNKCGTSYEIPKRLGCDNNENGCTPDITCSKWSSCKINYNFIDLLSGSSIKIPGTKSRSCKDQSGCAQGTEETQNCSAGVDIYTRRFTKCGKNYIGLYNSLNNKFIAKIDEGTKENPHLNIHLDEGKETPYCDYCFDGVKDGDETKVDCGGSCEPCSEKYKKTNFEEKTWRTGFTSWIKRMLAG